MIRTALLASALALSLGAPSVAQTLSVGTDVASAADLLYAAGDAVGAYEMLAAEAGTRWDDYEILWRAARAGVVVGVLQDGSEAQNRYLDSAIIFGGRALEGRPEGRRARYWRAAAAGRRAMNAGPGYAAELAQTVHDDGVHLLARDSLDAAAHNLMGKLYFEVMTLSTIERVLGRVFLSSDALGEASWDGAGRHLERAVELEPESVLYRFDWAAYLARRGPADVATRELEAVVALPTEGPADPKLKADARTLLESLRSPDR